MEHSNPESGTITEKRDPTLTILLTALVIFLVGVIGYWIFMWAPGSAPAVSEDTGATEETPLADDPEYQAAFESLYGDDLESSAAEFARLGEAAEGANKAQLLFLEGVAQSAYDPTAAIITFKEVIALDASDRTTASAYEYLVYVYRTNASQEIFDQVFSGDPYSSFKAPADAVPSQVDASFTNLLEHAATFYQTAAIEGMLAGAKANEHLKLTRKIYETCTRSPYRPIGAYSRFRFCLADLEELTPAEQDTFFEIQAYGNERLTNMNIDIADMQADPEVNPNILSRALRLRAVALNRLIIFGVGANDQAGEVSYTPEQVYVASQYVENAFKEAIAYAQSEGLIDDEARARLDYAVFLRTWYSLKDGLHEEIRDLVSVFYEDDRYHNTAAAKAMRAAYAAELESHNILTGMTVRGPARISEIDAAFRAYLEGVAGWDFESEAVSRHLGSDRTDDQFITTGPVDWVENF